MKTWKKWLMVVVAGSVFVHAVSIIMFPKAVMYIVIAITEGRAGGSNKLLHVPLATAEVREVVRPSPDMFYSVCIVDVSKKAVKVRTPVSEPYTSITVFNTNTDNIFAQNDLSAVNGWLEVTLTGPNSRLAENTGVVQLPTDKGLVLIRRVFRDRDALKKLDDNRRLAECKEI